MTREHLLALLTAVRDGTISIDSAIERLRDLPFEDLGFARIDHHRTIRTGMPEVIFSQSKTPAQVAAIFASLSRSGVDVLATRATPEQFNAVSEIEPHSVYHSLARCITLRQTPAQSRRGLIGIICAGTTDLPVAEEARITAELMGHTVDMIADVGVAGLHRLLAETERIRRADVLIVCAGMEGALPSVIGGLVAVPILAVPTSVGYGAAFGGITALLGMLNSCSPGISVVNIDNGFGAASIASLIVRKRDTFEEAQL